jgi:hypothetical protein
MGRQLRKVAANWQHPKNENGNYIPLLDGKFSERLAKWEEENEQWEKGFRDDWNGGWKPREADELNMTFAEWDGEKPVKEDYMPEWKEEQLTHIQLYENTSEGTPISPVYLASEIEKLCEYAAENCSTFADFKASKEEWQSMLDKDFVHHTSGNMTFI